MSDQAQQQGRARGRARGRGRATQPGDVRRPGEHIPQPQTQQPPPPQQQQPYVAQGGRAVHRAGIRTEQARPGEPPTREMAAMRLATGGAGDASAASAAAGRGAFRGRRDDYVVQKTRPDRITDKRGETGRPVTLAANFFKVISRPQWHIFQYHVEFAPIVESPRVRRGLLWDQKDKLGACFLFDGMNDLKSTTDLGKELVCHSKRATDGEIITITVKRTQELSPDHPEIIRLFNTQMRKNLQHLDYVLLGRHFFDKGAISVVTRHKLQVWQGVITSIQQHESALMMSVDTIHKLIREDNVRNQMHDIRSSQDGDFKSNCTRLLVGSIVMTGYNNKTYRVNDINWDQTPKSSFDMKGTQITYLQYYQKQYQIDIKDPGQPLLICESKEREVSKSGESRKKCIYLIPELCSMTGLTDNMRKDFYLMQDVGRQTRLTPQQRVENLRTFISRVNSNNQVRQEMTNWGIKFDNNLVQITARVLDSETIYQGQSQSRPDPRTADFSRDMRGKPMHFVVNITNWIVFYTEREENNTRTFISRLQQVCGPMNMQLRPPQLARLRDDRTSTFLEKIDEYLVSNDVEFVLFVLPNDRKERYDAIKKKVCIDKPVPSQVVLAKTIGKQQTLMSVSTKIAVQINSKLGGAPWSVNVPLKVPLMIVGFDAYHDSSRKGQSVGAFVASLNNGLTKWYSQASFHAKGAWQELSDHYQVHLINALKKFHQANGTLPQIIVFYRDGVGDGQIQYVINHELEQIKTSIKSVAQDYYPQYAYVIVNKRIGTRFFKKTNGDSYDNPEPGTIVDTEVTRNQRYDFFLVSQSVRQGTVSPTQYNIIHDTTTLKPEHMQRLTYKLTHLYYNWPGTIRVPAPCMYAHKLAFLVGQSLHRQFDTRLSDKLFYL